MKKNVKQINKKDTDTKAVMGRPLKFKSVKELQTAIDAYFKKCDERFTQVYDKLAGKVVKLNNPEPYTVSGLCLIMRKKTKTFLAL